MVLFTGGGGNLIPLTICIDVRWIGLLIVIWIWFFGLAAALLGILFTSNFGHILVVLSLLLFGSSWVYVSLFCLFILYSGMFGGCGAVVCFAGRECYNSGNSGAVMHPVVVMFLIVFLSWSKLPLVLLEAAVFAFIGTGKLEVGRLSWHFCGKIVRSRVFVGGAPMSISELEVPFKDLSNRRVMSELNNLGVSLATIRHNRTCVVSGHIRLGCGKLFRIRVRKGFGGEITNSNHYGKKSWFGLAEFRRRGLSIAISSGSMMGAVK
ncbi:hypothetical protein IEQ34_016269 [Dendrobium chrysotoxum]|uniref:NADH dehydrogenase subunit 6 n=1 Tax=Dendrobium chrysotoxum TaxID=161865 RepID=A0AAV7GDM5_DENCH|nr:hypothetical protein IEQ34_016269 [Dendrobium chrysotoxum]